MHLRVVVVFFAFFVFVVVVVIAFVVVVVNVVVVFVIVVVLTFLISLISDRFGFGMSVSESVSDDPEMLGNLKTDQKTQIV